MTVIMESKYQTAITSSSSTLDSKPNVSELLLQISGPILIQSLYCPELE